MKFILWMPSGVKQSNISGLRNTLLLASSLEPCNSFLKELNGLNWLKCTKRVVLGYSGCQFEKVHVNYSSTPQWGGWGWRKTAVKMLLSEGGTSHSDRYCLQEPTHPHIYISLYFAGCWISILCLHEQCCKTESRSGGFFCLFFFLIINMLAMLNCPVPRAPTQDV